MSVTKKEVASVVQIMCDFVVCWKSVSVTEHGLKLHSHCGCVPFEDLSCIYIGCLLEISEHLKRVSVCFY